MESRISIAYLRARPAPLPSPINAYVSAHNLNSFAAILYCEQKEKKWVAENMVRLERSLLKGNRWETRAPNIKAAGLLLTTQNQSWFQEQRVIFPLDTCNLLSNHLSRPGHLLCVVTFVPSWLAHLHSILCQRVLSFDLRKFQGRDNQLCVLPLPNVDIKQGYFFWSCNVLRYWLLTSSHGPSTFTTVTFVPSACIICLSLNCATSSVVSFLDKHIEVGHLLKEKASWPAGKRGEGQKQHYNAMQGGQGTRAGWKGLYACINVFLAWWIFKLLHFSWSNILCCHC